MNYCTGPSAFWCPVCGDCTCARSHNGECYFDNLECALHGRGSRHAETVELEGLRERIHDMATDLGVELTDNDHEAVSRFAQLLSERHRSKRTITPEAQELRRKLGVK